MLNENIEIRAIGSLRANNNDRTIQGTAIVFNSLSVDLGGFKELIKPSAVTNQLIADSDILFLFNHEDERVPLARSKRGSGTLSISITSTGVDFSFQAKDTAAGNEILAAVRSGDITSCSFAFRVADNGESWESLPDGSYLRTITAFESLHDFSLVNSPAYEMTSCRSLEKFKANLMNPAELEEYYKPYTDLIKSLKL